MTTRWYFWVFTVIRVVMGASFLQEAEHQIASGYIGGDGLHAKLTKGIDTAIPPYDYLIEHVLLKIDDPLTLFVIAGEIAVGATLVLGFFTRLAAAVAIIMNVNFLLMNGLHANSGVVDAAFIAGELLLLAFASVQALSLDAVLARNGVSGPLMSGDPPRARI